MSFRRLIALLALAALLVGAFAGPAFADKGRGSDDTHQDDRDDDRDRGRGSDDTQPDDRGGDRDSGRGSDDTQPDDRGGDRKRVSQQFDDMSDFEWGLEQVTKMQVKGIMKGRGDAIFAPGAKITLQETAVAISRLIDMESEWSLLASAEVLLLLQDMPDAASIDVWARPAVAGLIKIGVLEGNKAYRPLDDASRLDVAVLLVKALGYEAEAQRKMSAQLDFQDGHLIPAELRGYVAAAIDHGLITGYVEEGARTFRPNQAVKRVEMAVMLGRADREIERRHGDELKGTVKAVNAGADSVTIALRGGGEATVKLAAEAAVFVNGMEKSLADVAVGMEIEVKLNLAGLVIFVTAKTEHRSVVNPDLVIEGFIVGLSAAPAVSIGYIANGTFTMITYPVGSDTAIFVGGQSASFSSLQTNDSVRATIRGSALLKLEVTR